MPYFPGLEDATLVLNIFARNKERFGPYSVFMADVMRPTDTLSVADREAIALHVSAINGCHYCVGSHRAVLEELDLSHADISDIEAGNAADAKRAALLALAGKLTRSPSAVEEADINTAREAGASDQDIEDTIAIAAVFALMNRLVDGYGVKGNAAAFDMVGKSIVAGGGYDSVPSFLKL